MDYPLAVKCTKCGTCYDTRSSEYFEELWEISYKCFCGNTDCIVAEIY